MWESSFIEIDGVSFHYTRTGGDKPTLVLLHGITDLGLCWTAVARVLEADYDVFMLDARGHGSSDAPDTGYDWKTFAEDAKNVITGIGIEKPLILGHSMGAITAMNIAALYPDLPRAILLEDPPPFWAMTEPPAEADVKERVEATRKRLQDAKDKTRSQIIQEGIKEVGHWLEIEQQMWAESKIKASPKIADMFAQELEEDTLAWDSLYKNITCPTLLIYAEQYKGGLINDATAQLLKEQIPHLEIKNIPDAGHSIHRDQPDIYMKVVSDYLQKQTS